MPHRRGTSPSLEIWTLCLTVLIVCAPRIPKILANLLGVQTSHTFSPWLQRRISEYANYAGKSCSTCQQASNNLYTSDIYGYESVPEGRVNYMYEKGSGKSNCRKHLRKVHPAIYDMKVQENNWPYRLSTEEPDVKTTVGELCKRALPHFTLESFIEYLVRFIVADDQVSNHFLSLSLTHVLSFS
jgi:hypothetical protein